MGGKVRYRQGLRCKQKPQSEKVISKKNMCRGSKTRRQKGEGHRSPEERESFTGNGDGRERARQGGGGRNLLLKRGEKHI